MSTSYAGWSLDKLRKESAKIEKAIKLKESREKKKVVEEIKAVARKHGFSLSELISNPENSVKQLTGSKSNAKKSAAASHRVNKSKPPGRKKRAKAKIKYRNPGNSQETWTGRGRQPRWVVSHLENGGSIDQLSVSS